MEWSSEQFFKLDEQLRKLRVQLEDITWKLDSWERGLPATNKLRFEVKQYLEGVHAGQRDFLSTIEVVKSETLVPTSAVVRESNKESGEVDNSTTLFEHTRNQTDIQEAATTKPTEPLENSSGLDLGAALNQPSEEAEAANLDQIELLESQLPGIDAFKFGQRQPFRTMEINGRNYVEAESVYVAVCLVLIDWMHANDPDKLTQLKNEFLASDCSWVDENPSLPPEQATLTGDICKKVFLEYLKMLGNTPTNEVLEQYDLGYVLEAMLRQFIMNHTEELNHDDLKNFGTTFPQVQVLCELAADNRVLTGLEILDLEQGHEVTVIIGDSQCKLLTDLGGSSCFIEI